MSHSSLPWAVSERLYGIHSLRQYPHQFPAHARTHNSQPHRPSHDVPAHAHLLSLTTPRILLFLKNINNSTHGYLEPLYLHFRDARSYTTVQTQSLHILHPSSQLDTEYLDSKEASDDISRRLPLCPWTLTNRKPS